MGAGQLTVAAIHLGRAWFRIPSRRAGFELNSSRRHPLHWEAAWMRPCTCCSVMVSGTGAWRQILGLNVWRARLEAAHRCWLPQRGFSSSIQICAGVTQDSVALIGHGQGRRVCEPDAEGVRPGRRGLGERQVQSGQGRGTAAHRHSATVERSKVGSCALCVTIWLPRHDLEYRALSCGSSMVVIPVLSKSLSLVGKRSVRFETTDTQRSVEAASSARWARMAKLDLLRVRVLHRN